MSRALGPCLALCLVACVGAETIEFKDRARDPLRGRILVEFAAHLFVVVDGGAPRFVARGEVSRIFDEGGVAWVDPAPGTFARALPGEPRAALTDTTLEVRVIQRGHQPLSGGSGPVFLFEGDRAECEGAARLTLLDGTALTLGAGSSARVGATLELLRGEARLVASAGGARLSLDEARAVEVAAGGVALVSAGVDAHLYLERGRGAWALQGAKVELRPGQGAEVLLLGGGVRISADPTNADPLRVEPREDDGEPRPAVELAGGESYALGGAPLRGWALREVQGEVRVQRGTQRALHALAVAARDRVRLSGGDRVQTGSAASVALVRSGTGHLRLGPESALRVADALDLARGEVSLASTRPLAWAFGPRRAALSGRGSLRRQGPTWELQATDGALTWSDSGAALALEPGRRARLGVDADGWELEAPGERVQGAGWSVELPEFVALGLTLTPQRAELRCVGRRTWRVARGAAAAVDAEGRARFPNGAVVSLPVGGVAEVHTALWGAASVAEVGSPLRPADVAAVASDRPALLSLPSGLRLAVEGPLQLEVGGEWVRSGRTRLTVASAQTLRLCAPRGPGGVALSARAADRLDLPPGELRLVLRGGGAELRAIDRTLWIADDAPPVDARVINARGDWELRAEGLRALRYPAGAGGAVRVTADALRWTP